MLGSLIKFEFKTTYKNFMIFYLIILGFSAINTMYMTMASKITYMSSFFNSKAFGITLISFLFIFVLLLLSIAILTTFIIAQRFYKNIFGDAGYLMNTIPVKSSELILSKLVVSVFWICCGFIVSLISTMVILTSFITSSIDYGKLLHNIINIDIEFGEIIFFIKSILYMILELVLNILIIYSAISIGHLFNKHRKLAAFGAFLVITFIISIINNIISGIISLMYYDIANFLESIFDISIFINILYAVAAFTITNYIIKNKLNLQ